MSPKSQFVLVLCAALFLLGCGPPSDPMIVPGKRVGDVELGHTRYLDVAGSDGHALAKYEQSGLSFQPEEDDNSKVGVIEVSNSHFRTKEGLGIGDSEESVRGAYGLPEVAPLPPGASGANTVVIRGKALRYPGIEWQISEDDKVFLIVVRRS